MVVGNQNITLQFIPYSEVAENLKMNALSEIIGFIQKSIAKCGLSTIAINSGAFLGLLNQWWCVST